MPASAARRFSPPERSKGDFSANLSKSSPTKRIASATRSDISSAERPMFFGPKAMSLNTVSSNNWYSGYWNTIPTSCLPRRRIFLSHISAPSTTTRPELGCMSPLKCCTRVLLPEPVCPMTHRNSPSFTVRDTSSTALNASALPVIYTWFSFSTTMGIMPPQVHRYRLYYRLSGILP